MQCAARSAPQARSAPRSRREHELRADAVGRGGEQAPRRRAGARRRTRRTARAGRLDGRAQPPDDGVGDGEGDARGGVGRSRHGASLRAPAAATGCALRPGGYEARRGFGLRVPSRSAHPRVGEHRRQPPEPAEPARRRVPVLRRRARGARAVRRALVPQPLAARSRRATPSTSRAARRRAGTTTVPAVGACEVVLFSPEHDESLVDAPGRAGAQGRRPLGRAHRRRCSRGPRSSTCSCSRTAAARSARRSTTRTARSTATRSSRPCRRARRRSRPQHGCAVCAEVEAELADGERLVIDAGDWVAWVPFASATRTACARAPRARHRRSRRSTTRSRDDLAAALVDALARYDRLFDRAVPVPAVVPPRRPPPRARRAAAARAPESLRYVASGELGSGTLSNPVVPEDAAAALRDA